MPRSSRLLCFCFFLLLLFRPTGAEAQKGIPPFSPYFNSDSFWHTLRLMPFDSRGPCPTGLSVLVVSNRKLAADSLRFLTQDRDADSLRYYFVTATQEGWQLTRMPGLHAGVAQLRCAPERQDRDWVVYTEGMGKVFTSDLNRAFRMAQQYEVNVLLLDYPSIHAGLSSLKNFKFARSNAQLAGTDFVPVWDSLQGLRRQGLLGKGRFSLFFHSLGNQAMRSLAKSPALAPLNGQVWVDNLVLNAPCVPRRHAALWINKIAFARRIFVHYNPHDATLKWARLASLHGILGERPSRPLSPKAHYINFHLLCGRGHSNFLSLQGRAPAMPEAVDFYRVLLHGAAPDPKEFTNLKPSGYKGIGQVLWPWL